MPNKQEATISFFEIVRLWENCTMPTSIKPCATDRKREIDTWTPRRWWERTMWASKVEEQSQKQGTNARQTPRDDTNIGPKNVLKTLEVLKKLKFCKNHEKMSLKRLGCWKSFFAFQKKQRHAAGESIFYFDHRKMSRPERKWCRFWSKIAFSLQRSRQNSIFCP